MFNFFSIIITTLGLIIEDEQYYCECDTLVYEQDCRQSDECEWQYNEIEISSNPKPNIKNYGNIKFVNQGNFDVISKGFCTNEYISCSYQTKQICKSKYWCAWIDGQGCQEFNHCQDYQTASQDGCQEIHEICINGDLVNQMYVCKELIVENCSSQINADSCNYYYQSDNKSCYFSDNVCKALFVYECYDAINEVLCPSYCTWTVYGCIQKKCSDIKNQDECQFVYGFGLDITICQFNGVQCIEVTDISQLTKEDCYRNSMGRLQWKDDYCQYCQKLQGGNINNYQLIILFPLILAQL